MYKERVGKRRPTRADPFFCQECRHLLDGFTDAVHEVITLSQRHLLALSQNDPDSHRFDLLIHKANEKKQNAEYAYVSHIEAHVPAKTLKVTAN
jgi:hypothetical protein